MIEKLTRDFTVAVFVIASGHVILHPHRKLGIWLPPGGHIEPNELPDEAAHREVREEAGIDIHLVGGKGLPSDYPGQPVQLIRPEGIQLESIGPGHEHIDLIYFARPRDLDAGLPPLLTGMEWVPEARLAQVDLNQEVRDWCQLAFAASRSWSTLA